MRKRGYDEEERLMEGEIDDGDGGGEGRVERGDWYDEEEGL